MIKDKVFMGLAIINLFTGYFVYDYISRINPNYEVISLMGILAFSLVIFSFSTKGKSFWLFLGDIKREFAKIYFPKMNEVLNGLKVVFIFVISFMIIIWLLDSMFLKLYQLTM